MVKLKQVYYRQKKIKKKRKLVLLHVQPILFHLSWLRPHRLVQCQSCLTLCGQFHFYPSAEWLLLTFAPVLVLQSDTLLPAVRSCVEGFAMCAVPQYRQHVASRPLCDNKCTVSPGSQF